MKFVKGWLVAVVVVLAYACPAQNFDIDLLKSINEKESGFKNDFFKADAQSVTLLNIAAPVTILTVGLIRHDKQLQRDAVYMIGGYALSTILTHGLKITIQRQRPFDTYSFIVKRTEGGGYSFPSGHTSAAFCTATSLSLLFPKWYVIAPSYVWAASVGYARLYQGVHYPSDVLAGAIVGAGSAWIAYKFQKYMDKKSAPKKAARPAAL